MEEEVVDGEVDVEEEMGVEVSFCFLFAWPKSFHVW